MKVLKGALCLMLSLQIAPAALAALPKARQLELENGLRVVFAGQHHLPLVCLTLVVPDGSRSDPSGREGLASLTSDLLQEGTKARSAEEIARAVDFLGATLEAETDFDLSILSLSVLAKDFEAGLAILAEVLLEPTFPEAELIRKRQEMLAAIEAEQEDPGKVADRAQLAALFGPHHPYSHPPQGTEAGLKDASRQDVLAHYRRHYLPNQCILVAVGDFKDKDLLKRLESALGGWRKGKPPQLKPPALKAAPKPQVLIDQPISQANISIGRRAIERSDPDFYALQVGNYILGGGGFASRLVEEVRARRGLAYAVSSSLDARAWPGSFEVVMQTSNATARAAIDLVRAEVARMGAEKVSAQELEAAQRYLIGSFPLRLDTNAKLARYLALVSFYGLGLDFAERYPGLIAAQTPEKILAAWRRKIAPNEPSVVVVGNLAEAGLQGDKSQ